MAQVMSEYADRFQAARRVRSLTLQDEREARRQLQALYGAWRRVAASDDGKVILDNLALILLKPCERPEDEGARRLVLTLFQTIREALAERQEEDITG
jgi:hypothetical protein